MHLAQEQPLVQQTRVSPRILVVGGGKGGVGKTCFSVNVAIDIARRGWRVVLVDADLCCSNIEMVLGLQAQVKLDDFFHQRGNKDIRAILCDTPYENLKLIPGTTGLIEAANPKYQQKAAFIRELQTLEADLVVVDLDAGAHLNTLDFFLMTDTNGVLVITPEKTSIDNAFKFLRAAVHRKIERFYQSSEVGALLKRTASLSQFVDLLSASPHFGEELRKRICGEIVAIARTVRPRIVVNRARNAYEAQIAANILSKFARQNLLTETENLGFIYFDRCVPEAVNSGTPFVVSNPRHPISVCIADIANRLGFY